MKNSTGWKTWGVLLLLTLAMLISYIARTNFSVVLAFKDFQHQFGLTDQDRGVLNSAFFWSYTLLQVPAGWVVDRYGIGIPYAIGFCLWSGVSASTAMLGSMGQLMISRLLLGVGEAISSPASIKWIQRNWPERNRGLATGIYFSGTKIGLAAAAPLTVWLSRDWGWRGMFLILGLGALVWLIPWLMLVGDDRPPASERKKLDAPNAVSLASILKVPAMWGILIGSFCYQYFVYFCMTWMPAYYVEARHLSLTKMGLFQLFSFGGMAIIAVLGGWMADLLISRGGDPMRTRRIFIVLGFAIASTELIGALTHSDQVAIVFSIISIAGLGFTTANYWALTQSLVPSEAMGRAIGAQNFAANASGAAAPLITGWLKAATGSYAAPLSVSFFFLVLGAVAYLFIVTPRLARFQMADVASPASARA